MPTKRAPDVVNGIKSLLESNQSALGLQYVDYGRTGLLPRYPSALVSSRSKSRNIHGSHHFQVTFDIQIILELGKVQSVGLTEEEIDELVESVEDILHADLKVGTDIIAGFVYRTEHGIKPKENVMIQAVRMLWTGESREVF